MFVSEAFTRACERLGISVPQTRPRTPADKAIVESTFSAINTLFCQHVASSAGSNPTRRRSDVTGAWTLSGLQEMLDEWLLVGLADPPARRMTRYAIRWPRAGCSALTKSTPRWWLRPVICR